MPSSAFAFDPFLIGSRRRQITVSWGNPSVIRFGLLFFRKNKRQVNSCDTSVMECADTFGSIPKEVVQLVVNISSGMFPGPVTYEFQRDPEDESHAYLVFDVVAKGEYADYRERIFQWYDEVEKVIPDRNGRLQLVVHPQR